MGLEPENIQHELEMALAALTELRGERLAGQVRHILFTNLDRGRIQGFILGRLDLIPAYVRDLVDRFEALHDLLHKLQTERDTESWEPLFDRMQTWAYNFFLRKSFTADGRTQEIAAECATEAAIMMLSAYFPYDTDFDAWAHIIVQNACRKFIGRSLKKSTVPEDHIVELEDNLVNPNDILQENRTLQHELDDELTNALAQLTDARRTVIQATFFDELEPEEIAQKMGKSVSAIYSLQFNGLQDLRKILSKIRDSINERE